MNERIVGTLCEMVQISSESGDEAEFISYLQQKLTRDFGATCTLDSYGNLIAKIPAKNCSVADPLLFAMHADTVKPGRGIKPIVQEGMVRSSGDTILGGDCKAGIAEFVEAVQTATKHPPLEVVVTREEEIGFGGARHLDYGLIKAKKGFLLDMDAMDTIVVGGPSHMLIDVEIVGRAAHAGMEPEKGISAIKAAANAISIINDGRIDYETTANVGIIEGGLIRNGVPEKVSIKAEVRSLNHQKCIQLSDTVKAVYEVAARAMGATATVNLTLAYKATQISPDTAMVKLTRTALNSVGIEPRIISITGGLESALYNEKGIETIPIGNGVQAEHSTDEHILVADMEKIVKVLHYLFDHFCQ